MHLLQYARHEGCNFEASVTAAAAKHEHFDLLKWLASQKCAWDDRTCTFLAASGHLEVSTFCFNLCLHIVAFFSFYYHCYYSFVFRCTFFLFALFFCFVLFCFFFLFFFSFCAVLFMLIFFCLILVVLILSLICRC